MNALVTLACSVQVYSALTKIYISSSQQSIQKVVGFAAKHFPSCGEDIWDCIVEHMENVRSHISLCCGCLIYFFLLFVKGSINSRINVLYFLDSLCETSLMVKAQSKSVKSQEINANGLYLFFISRDLQKIIDLIVPEGRQGLPNLISTKQVRYGRPFIHGTSQDSSRYWKIGEVNVTLILKKWTRRSCPWILDPYPLHWLKMPINRHPHFVISTSAYH